MSAKPSSNHGANRDFRQSVTPRDSGFVYPFSLARFTEVLTD
jgi:hypothetical protein